jgi:hypothetical protein
MYCVGCEGPESETEEWAAIQSVASTWLRKRGGERSFSDPVKSSFISSPYHVPIKTLPKPTAFDMVHSQKLKLYNVNYVTTEIYIE